MIYRTNDEEARRSADRDRQHHLDEQLVNWGTNMKKTTDKIEDFARW